MKSFFITATGTEIGKTFITTALCHQLKQKNFNVNAIKPIITGYNSENNENDLSILSSGLRKMFNVKHLKEMSCYDFEMPLSPDMAAKKENKVIELEKIITFCKKSRKEDFFFIEGIGGVMVPLNDSFTILDLIEKHNIPVILVTGTYLGTLSHTLTALLALESRRITVHAVVVNETENSDVSIDDTIDSLKNFTKSILLYKVPRIKQNGVDKHWKIVPDLTSIVDQ